LFERFFSFINFLILDLYIAGLSFICFIASTYFNSPSAISKVACALPPLPSNPILNNLALILRFFCLSKPNSVAAVVILPS